MEINFVKDEEINLKDKDLLGTSAYVKTLLEIIKNTQAPFTIGLLGGWGTGKSSIIRTIKAECAEQNLGIEIFVYDAWKYSEDSFRRTFILELQEQFNLEIGGNYESFYNDEHQEVGHSNSPDATKAFFGGLFLFPILLLLIWFTDASEDLRIAITAVGIMSSLILYFLKDVFVQYKVSVTRPKTFAPEQFEDAFSDAIQSITNPSKAERLKNWLSVGDKTINAKRIVIVIDNIDRCHKELAFELLLTVKSFLEQKNTEVLFILPIDEKETIKHLRKKGHNGNEFLRKLFNTTITVRDFSEDDLFNFTKKIQDTNNLKLPDDVLSLISQEFSKSPRKIIQFLNVLQTEIHLANELEKSENIPKGSIIEDLSFLTKILLIREEWDGLYNSIKNRTSLLHEINEYLRTGTPKPEVDDLGLTKEQIYFFSRTRHIHNNNIEAFILNKDSFWNVPDGLNKLVTSQAWEEIKELLKNGEIEFQKLVEFIDNKYKQDVTERGLINTTGINVISLILKISNDPEYKEQLYKLYYGKFRHFGEIKADINSPKIKTLILKLNPELLLNFIESKEDQNKILLSQLVAGMNSEKDKGEEQYELLTQYIKRFSENKQKLRSVSTTFSDLIEEFPDIFDDFEKVLQSVVAMETLISKKTLESFIDSLDRDTETGQVSIKTKILDQYNLVKGLPNKTLDLYANKIISLLMPINEYEDLAFWLNKLSPLLLKYGGSMSQEDEIFNALSKKYTMLWNDFNARHPQEDFQASLKAFLNTVNNLYLISGAARPQIQAWLKQFLTRTELPFLESQIYKLYYETVRHFSVFEWDFVIVLIKQFQNSKEWNKKLEIAKTLNHMLAITTEEKGLSQSQIRTILQDYIDAIENDEAVAREWLSNGLKNTVIRDELIVVIEGLNDAEKLRIIKTIKEIDDDLLKKTVNELISSTDTDELQDVIETLEHSSIGLTQINNAIEKNLRSIEKDDQEDYLKDFINVISERNLTQSIATIIVSKISSYLHDEKTLEERVFALSTLNNIPIPKAKKRLVKELAKNLNTDEFSEEELKIIKKLRK